MLKFIKKALFGTTIGYSKKLDHHKRVLDNTDKTRQRCYSARQLPDNIEEIVSNLNVGDLSANTNWASIEKLGNYLSPIGRDNPHKIVLTKSVKRAGTIHVATIKCTNSIYSEWVACLCETMWHIDHKVLEDIHGNKYPLGQMLELECSVVYD